MRPVRPTLICLLIVAAFAAEAQTIPTPAPAVPTAPPSTTDASGKHTLNLKGADIGVLIQTVSEITGKSFIIDPRVDGKVTIVSSRPMDADELYETFQSVLRVHGFAAVPAGASMVKILPEAMAVQDGGTANAPVSGKDELVTRLIPVKHVPAPQLVELLRPLMPQQGHFTAHAGSNSLLITDRVGNVDRLAALIARIDTATDNEVEVIALRHAAAAEVARTLAAFDAPTGANAPLTPSGFKMVADDRTNSVLLSGDKSQRLRYRALIAHLDTPLSSGENTQVIYLRNAKAADLMPILEGVADTLTGTASKAETAKPATIQVHEDTNALIVTASPAVYRELQAVVRQLDVRRAQVLVEAVIAEVSDDLADELGVQWQSTSYDGGANERGVIGGTNFPNSQGAGSIIGAIQDPFSALGSSGGLNLGYVGGRVTIPGPNGRDITVFQVGALVRALRGDGRANVLSNPSVVTLDHQEAMFKVVQEVPFLTGQYTNTSTNGGTNQPTNPFQTVDRKDVGIILTVTPHVNEGDAVKLEIKQEVSALAPNVNGAVDLITNKRELSTSVMVQDGGLLVLGGLKQEETRDNTSGVPGISRVPLIGNLFKSRASSKSKRNLMVFLRPTILRDAAAEQSISSEKYNVLRGEQIRRRENHELRWRNEQPVLPELPLGDAPYPLDPAPAAETPRD